MAARTLKCVAAVQLQLAQAADGISKHPVTAELQQETLMPDAEVCCSRCSHHQQRGKVMLHSYG